MRKWLLLALAAWAMLAAIPAAAACPAERLVREELAKASAERDPQRRSGRLRQLAMMVAPCVPRTPAGREAIHAAVIASYDLIESGSSVADMWDGGLLWDDLDDARTSGDTARYAQVAWRLLVRQPRDGRVFDVGNQLEGYVAEQARVGRGGVLALAGRDLEGAALLSPTLCLLTATKAVESTDPELAFESGKAALPCLAKYSGGVPLGQVVVSLARHLRAGPIELASDRAKLLLAYAALGRDGEVVSAVLQPARGILSRLSGRQASALRLAMVVALEGAGRTAESRAIADACIEEEDFDSDPCDLAVDYLDLRRGRGDGGSLGSSLRKEGLDSNPVNGFLALAYTSVSGRDVNWAAAQRSAGDMIAGPKLLRLCKVEDRWSKQDEFVTQLVVHGGPTSNGDRIELLSCMQSKLIGLSDDLRILMLAGGLIHIDHLPLEQTARFRLLAAKALLVRAQPFAPSNPKAIVDAYLRPFVSPSTSIPTEARRDALLLLARSALDSDDVAAAAGWRRELSAMGVAIPQALKAQAPTLLRPPSPDAETRLLKGLFDRMLAINSASMWRRNVPMEPSTLLIRASRHAEPDYGEALAAIRRLRAAPGSLRTGPMAHCLPFALDRLEATFAPLAAPLDARIDEVVPGPTAMRKFLERSVTWPGARTPPPFSLARSKRTLSLALEDLELAMVVWEAVGRPAQMWAAERVRAAVVAELPVSPTRCEGLSWSFETQLPDAIRDVLLTALSSDPLASRSNRFGEVVAEAIAPRGSSRLSRERYATPEQRRLRREEHKAERELRAAVEALDVEAARAAQAKQAAVWEQQDPVGRFSSLPRAGDALRAARSGLRNGEAILSTVRIFVRGADTVISTLVTRDQVNFAVKRSAEISMVTDNLGLSVRPTRRGVRTPFDIDAAHALYQLVLDGLPLDGIRRIYVAYSPLSVPMGALVSKPASTAATADQRYARSRYVLDDYEVAYLGPSLSLPDRAKTPITQLGARTVIFASPDYGTTIPADAQRTTCGMPAVDDLASEWPTQSSESNLSMFLGENATESKLYEADRASLLRQSSLLLFYAHGAEAPGGARGRPQRAIALAPAPACGQASDGPVVEDGFLQPDEVETLDLGPATWVMLAGCETAKEGEWEPALAQAFFDAGAKLVIGSVEDVAADSTALMVNRVLSSDRGQDPVAAMAAAVRAIRSQAAEAFARDPDDRTGAVRWLHPAFFAPWKVIIK